MRILDQSSGKGSNKTQSLMLNQSNEHSRAGNRSIIEIELKNAYDTSEYATLENYLSKLPGVKGVHLDRTRGVAHLTYDSSATTAEAIEADLDGCGYKCVGNSCVPSKCQPGHPSVGTEDRVDSDKVEADGTFPASVNHAHAGHVMGRPRRAAAHAEMKHDEHGGHGAGMVHDLLRRFIVSIILSMVLST
jgi:P-type Cu2+ transporter